MIILIFFFFFLFCVEVAKKYLGYGALDMLLN